MTIMKNSLYVFLFVMISMSLTSCQLVGDIFKAGVWVGILAVAAVIGLIIFLISKLSGKK
jgi:hypothetical protein